jgi:hypothetical protein
MRGEGVVVAPQMAGGVPMVEHEVVRKIRTLAKSVRREPPGAVDR